MTLKAMECRVVVNIVTSPMVLYCKVRMSTHNKMTMICHIKHTTQAEETRLRMYMYVRSLAFKAEMSLKGQQ